LSVLLHPDKNRNDPRAQQAFEEVKKAKNHVLGDRARHSQMLVEEGIKKAEAAFKGNPKGKTLEQLKETEVMRIFAHIEQKRREVEDRERKFEQRTQQQEDEQEMKERQARQFDKSWRKDDRVHKRVGNWRDFAQGNKKPKI
jgi:DnaJ family protein C protein 8